MLLTNLAGTITPEIISLNGGLNVWARHWLEIAIEAEKSGNTLIVYEMPKNGLYRSVQPPNETPDSDLLDNELTKALNK